MSEINLSNSEKTVLVDDDMYGGLNKYKWYLLKGMHYAYRSISENGVTGTILMHRAILGLVPGDKKYTDHINMNKLDNRKENLRICTFQQNTFNIGKTKANTSGMKGVSLDKRVNKWQARIKVDGKSISLGYFKKLTDAGKAYNEGAKKYHGEFARLNEISG